MLVMGTAALLAGCTAAGSTEPAGTASTGESAGQSFVDPLTSTSPVRAKLGPITLATSPDPSDLSVTWRLDGISSDRTQLFLSYLTGNDQCFPSAGFHVEESEKSIVLTATVRNPGDAGDCSSDVPATGRGYLTLQAPLGERELVHSPLSANWAGIEPADGSGAKY
jgi:hypothetical protein